MKRLILILSLIMLIGCKSKSAISTSNKTTTETKSNETKKIAILDVDKTQKDKAYELGKRVLMSCNTSKFKPFNSSEATQKVIDNTTQDRLTKICLKYRLRYGDFIDLKLVEVYKLTKENQTVFRYKALYQKEIANKELQVTMNEQNQISSIKSLDWTDTFEYK